MSHYFETSPSAESHRITVSVLLPGDAFDYTTDSGVFSHGRLDAGTKILLSDAPPPPGSGTFLDLGCGAGPIALSLALFINAAILIVAAATFHQKGHSDVAEIQDAHKLLTPLLGVGGASTVFALALLASGQNSTLTGTLAGQIVMEGFLDLRLRPWVRRLITRTIAIIPAVIVAAWRPLGTPCPAASTPTSRTPGTSRNGWKIPIAFEPPPTQAMTTSGSRPTRLRICERA